MKQYRLIIKEVWAKPAQGGGMEICEQELYQLPLRKLEEFNKVCQLAIRLSQKEPDELDRP